MDKITVYDHGLFDTGPRILLQAVNGEILFAAGQIQDWLDQALVGFERKSLGVASRPKSIRQPIIRQRIEKKPRLKRPPRWPPLVPDRARTKPIQPTTKEPNSAQNDTGHRIYDTVG